MKKIIIQVLLVFMLLSSAFAVPTYDDLSEEDKLAFTNQAFKVEQKVTAIGRSFLPSSTAQTLAVQDPFASPGQPVMIEFTLSNVGAEFPFNQIPLPADSFALMIAIDPDLNFRTSDGREIDIFEKMNGIEKFLTTSRLGAVKIADEIGSEFTGRQCEFIDIYKHLPKSVQEDIIERNNGKNPDGVFAWDCLRATNEEFFKDTVEDVCGDEGYSSTCLAKINNRGTNALTDNTVVALVSDVPKGTCEAVRGNTVVSFFAQNVVKCGIGSNGLNPGESVTLRFYAVVPSDTPAVNPDNLDSSGEVLEFTTYSQSCLDSQFPLNCHTIYAGVFPVKTSNLLTWFVDGATNSLTLGSCAFNKLYNGANTDYGDCVKSRASGVSTIGEPIWEGRGTFFVLAPDLAGSVTLVLLATGLVGALGGYLVTRRR